MQALRLLSSYAQTRYIYHIDNGNEPFSVPPIRINVEVAIEMNADWLLLMISLIFHVIFSNSDAVESNDQLYIGDEEFQEHIRDSCTSLLTELLNEIQQLGADKHYRQQVIFTFHSFKAIDSLIYFINYFLIL